MALSSRAVSTPISSASRLYALDVSRGAAALSVVLWHWQHFAFDGYTLPLAFLRPQQPAYPLLRLFYERGDVGVDYFFVLSGFVFFWLFADEIHQGLLSARRFALQRFSRLYPLHFATLVAVAALQMLYEERSGRFFVYSCNNAERFLLHLVFASHWPAHECHSFNAPVWSVSIEVLLYAFFFVLARIGLVRASVALAVAAGAYVMGQFNLHPYIFRGMTAYFLGGVTFYFVRAASVRGAGVLVIGACAGAWVLLIVNFYVHPLTPYLEGRGRASWLLFDGFRYALLTSTVAALVLLELRIGSALFGRIAWIGDITYASYLLHFPLQLCFALLVASGFLPGDFWRSPTALVVFFALLVGASRTTFTGFEMPMQTWIRRIGNATSAHARAIR